MASEVAEEVDCLDAPIFAIHMVEIGVHFIYLIILTSDVLFFAVLTEHSSHLNITGSEGGLQDLIHLKLAIEVERKKRLFERDRGQGDKIIGNIVTSEVFLLLRF